MILAFHDRVGEGFALAEKLGLSHRRCSTSPRPVGAVLGADDLLPCRPVPTSPANNGYKPGFGQPDGQGPDLGQDAAKRGAATPLGKHAQEI